MTYKATIYNGTKIIQTLYVDQSLEVYDVECGGDFIRARIMYSDRGFSVKLDPRLRIIITNEPGTVVYKTRDKLDETLSSIETLMKKLK